MNSKQPGTTYWMPTMLVKPTDQLNRPVRDLRISLTDRCQFRCRYCLPAEHVDVMRQQSRPENHLNFQQIIAAVEAFAQLGVNKIRLTGGEPLLRKNVPDLVRELKGIAGIDDVALTTNAALLEPQLPALIDAGLDRITISLDAIEQALFESITGTEYAVPELLRIIELCAQSSIKKIKLNCVVQKQVNEHQIIPILEHFRGSRVVTRFIEFMDVGNLNQWQADQVFEAKDMLALIQQHWSFSPTAPTAPGEVASRYTFDDGQGEFGLISSISQPFCGDCNRARLGTNGHIYTCLFSHQGHDIKPNLSQPDALLEQLQGIWQNRKDQYSMQRQRRKKQQKNKIEMFMIGG